MRLAIFSDIHCTDDNRDACLSALDTAVPSLEAIDYVVLLGDQITNVDAETDARLMQDVADRFALADAAVRAVPGNHDVEELHPGDTVAPFGHGRYGREQVAGQELVFLDSSAPWLHGSRGAVSAEQREYLERLLPDVEDALVFIHHPLHHYDLSENPWFSQHPERAFCGNKKEVNALFEEFGGVQAVFSGHIHDGHYVRYGGVDRISVPDFTRGCPAEGSEVLGRYLVVDVQDGEMQVEVRTPAERLAVYDI